ncbi:MAG: ABC transporter substrate-binding protein, partial [Mailhella sp.]|nr:ABC transporter substrate-binding protein [Mailhella sp.]
MKKNPFLSLFAAAALLVSLCVPAGTSAAEPAKVTVTDMIGRTVDVVPGSYKRVVCIGAGALRMYSYIGDTALLGGVEDIDNTTLAKRPKMFDSTARPYMLAFGSRFAELPSCGVGGPNAQAAEAEKILSCSPDIVISEYEDVQKEDALQEQLGVPVVTLKSGPGGVFDQNFFGTLRLLGTIFQNSEKAESLIRFIEKERADISGRTAGIPEAEKPSVYICGLGNWGT